jgi:hypothetical protein
VGPGGPWALAAQAMQLRVVFASRPGGRSRTLLNEAELLAECNSWTPPDGAAWTSAVCAAYEFGRAASKQLGSGDTALLSDAGMMTTADVLVCVHGAACLNAFFMPDGSSLVELRPLGMSAGWANQYFMRQLQHEKLIHWYGVDVHDKANSRASDLEVERPEVVNDQVAPRERHVRLPWRALKNHLDLLAQVGRDNGRYRAAFRSGKVYVTDKLELVTARPKMPKGTSW